MCMSNVGCGRAPCERRRGGRGERRSERELHVTPILHRYVVKLASAVESSANAKVAYYH